MKIPAHIKAAIRELGLRTQDETLQVLTSENLELASKLAVKAAAYHGDRGQWWWLWLDIQDALGRSAEDALTAVEPRSLRWLEQWAAMRRGRKWQLPPSLAITNRQVLTNRLACCWVHDGHGGHFWPWTGNSSAAI
jgi:hypothetical protein